MSKISSNLSRRNKSLKQMLQSEREAAMRAAGQKFKERKRKEDKSKGRLVGAALLAATRREEREKKERERVKEEGGEEEVEEEVKEEAKEEGKEETEEKVEEERDPNTPKRDLPTYSSVEAPPSLRPAKKYCDVTGLIAPYTDPKSGLRYHSVEVYEIIKQFGPGVGDAYLSLRGDGSQIK
uniref:Vps72/YL1 C-terminal domain-containing protein n=2 Tax=Kalmanozyma brasiliensis (strain GHG001) TaxID=1365824 RepID=V5EEF6_KALBG